MNKELRESRQVVAVLTIEDIETYLWEEQVEQLNALLKVIEDSRKKDSKKESRLLIFDNLPSVQPEQKMGKWLCRCNKDREEWLECSKCGHEIGVRYTKNYCPNCGRKMMGEGVK